MKVLLTGAFGNIGLSTLDELLQRGHQVRCFDLDTPRNRRVARRYRHRIDLAWGDLRSPGDVAAAVEGQEVVIHAAAVIPRLSTTGISSEDRPGWAREVNVGGTRNLLEAMKALPDPPCIVYTSSLHVFGRTQDQPSPRTASDTPHPIEHYARHKLECEWLIRDSGLRWAIVRLGAALPVRLILDKGMFDVPLDNRIEFVHSRDVGLALANLLECPEAWGKILLLGGGPNCRYRYGDLLGTILGSIGVGSMPRAAFATVPYSVDWLDTEESQGLLHYQTRTVADYIADVRSALGRPTVAVIRAFHPLVRRVLLSQSPYLRRQPHPGGRKPALSQPHH